MCLKRLVQKAVAKVVNTLSQSSVAEIDDGLSTSPHLQKLCRQVGAESCVLLKNDEVLPISNTSNVAVFGRVQINSFFTGYGSGGDVKAPYKISFIDGLLNSGISINNDLYSTYKSWCIKNKSYDGFWGFWPMNYDEMPLTDNIVSKASETSDVAIVFIGRSSGEDRESKLKKGSWYLTRHEENMLKKVTAAFKKVCVVLNCGSVMDAGWLSKYNVGAVLYAWQCGQESGNAVADVICGKVNPSGKLTGTIALYNAYPSAKNFGKRKYNNYAEDIYVGYRFFETFAKDDVIFPFGFGLSYTTFDIKIKQFIVTDKITIIATVTNVGSIAGKEVVQIYYSPPQGVIGKANKNLIAFAKTKLLQPNEKQEVNIEFDINEMASYDDSGLTGHINSYILEKGKYVFYTGTDVKTTQRCGEYVLEKDVVVSTTENACGIKNSFLRVVNNNGKIEHKSTLVQSTKLKQRILDSLPKTLPQLQYDGGTLQDVIDNKIALEQFISQLTDDELEAIVRGSDDGMYSPLGIAGNAGVFGGTTASLRKKGVPIVCTNDGPSGIRLQAHSTLIPNGVALASTFDVELVKQLLFEIGTEQKQRNSHVLLAPGMNIHRNPLCGRNFEYYSEDPVLTGKIASAYVSGVQAAGVSAVPKHFACNNQEKGRHINDSRVSTRALREIYLKGFEICVKEAEPHFIMTAYNKVNDVLCCYNYDLATEILRKEWGFSGVVLTDWWINKDSSSDFKNVCMQAYRIRAQVDVFMPGTAKFGKYKGKADGTLLKSLNSIDGITRGEIQRSAINILEYCIKKCTK